jgi:hypothetical protein
MKNLIFFIALVFAMAVFSSDLTYSQDTTKADAKNKKPTTGVKHQYRHRTQNFVDKNGDGYNDNAPDDDGDGIPNGLDPDYVKKSELKNNKDLPYIDLNGDGINDNLQKKGKNKNKGRNSQKNIKPQDGTNSGNNTQGKGQNDAGKKRGKG